VVKTGGAHPVCAALRENGLKPVTAKVWVTNAGYNVKSTEASCAEIDLVAYDIRNDVYACVEIKRTGKTMRTVLDEHDEAPRCRKTGRKRSFFDKARMQCQLGSIFFGQTYDLPKVEAFLAVITTAKDGKENVNLFSLKEIPPSGFEWIRGFHSVSTTDTESVDARVVRVDDDKSPTEETLRR
jgi:hypothetical protein